MKPWMIILIVLAVMLVILAVLYFLGKRMQKKQVDNRAQMEAMAQTMSMLIIDKKYMKLSEANLPKIVLEQTPKALRRTKVPIVKAKIGPKIMSLICDDAIFDELPVKAEVKASISGIYIIGVKNLRGAQPAPVSKKTGFIAKLKKRQAKLEKQLQEEQAASGGSKKKGKK
ncbi:MAG: hypothetical protein IJA10_01910 [Lachnospiraceae bacterium]|nr:hypothetical protein [Lachnospiraceae bacterium]